MPADMLFLLSRSYFELTPYRISLSANYSMLRAQIPDEPILSKDGLTAAYLDELVDRQKSKVDLIELNVKTGRVRWQLDFAKWYKLTDELFEIRDGVVFGSNQRMIYQITSNKVPVYRNVFELVRQANHVNQ
jgi:hypothetical protein